jgi:hypothetical protein
MRRFAEGLLRRYDRSGNGSLEKEEWSQMSERYAAADANKDSVITVEELATHLSNFSRGSGPSSGGGPGGDRDQGDGDALARGRGGWGARRGEPEQPEPQKKSYRFLSPAERLQNTLEGGDRDWFLDKDQNGDGQIAMSEFSGAWSQETLEEFSTLDLNADGMITPKEYVRAKSD